MAITFPPVVPYLYDPDATEALEFLVRAFGFEEHAVTRDANGIVWNAQVRTGSGLVMIGPGVDEFGTRAVSQRARSRFRVSSRRVVGLLPDRDVRLALAGEG